MTTRREFLGALGAFTTLGVGLSASALSREQHRDDYARAVRQLGAYVPAGLVRVGTPEGMRVDYVTLDGVRVENAFECNDVEGWVEHYAFDDIDDRTDNLRIYPRKEHLTGVVRIVWKA